MPNAEPPPVVIAEGVGHVTRYFLREVGSVFWLIANTFEETFERIQHGRLPFRAASFFRHTERVGVDSVPLVGLVSFFLGLTMALLTGYQLQRFGTERLIPGLVAIAFTRELGPLLTGIMIAARIGAAFTAELGTMQVSEEVEAIEAMGIGPLRFLVAPRMLALVSADAVSLHGFEHRGHIRQQPGLQSLFQYCLSLLFRSRERFIAHPRHYHRHFKELSVRSADRRDRLLPGTDSERRRRRSRCTRRRRVLLLQSLQ